MVPLSALAASTFFVFENAAIKCVALSHQSGRYYWKILEKINFFCGFFFSKKINIHTSPPISNIFFLNSPLSGFIIPEMTNTAPFKIDEN